MSEQRRFWSRSTFEATNGKSFWAGFFSVLLCLLVEFIFDTEECPWVWAFPITAFTLAWLVGCVGIQSFYLKNQTWEYWLFVQGERTLFFFLGGATQTLVGGFLFYQVIGRCTST